MTQIKWLTIVALILIIIGNMAFASSGSRLIQEVIAPDQTMKRIKGMPVIISKKKYGTPVRWKSIWDNNKPMIKDPNLIFAGFTLYYIPDNSVALN